MAFHYGFGCFVVVINIIPFWKYTVHGCFIIIISIISGSVRFGSWHCCCCCCFFSGLILVCIFRCYFFIYLIFSSSMGILLIITIIINSGNKNTIILFCWRYYSSNGVFGWVAGVAGLARMVGSLGWLGWHVSTFRFYSFLVSGFSQSDLFGVWFVLFSGFAWRLFGSYFLFFTSTHSLSLSLPLFPDIFPGIPTRNNLRRLAFRAVVCSLVWIVGLYVLVRRFYLAY